jgi:uncharacterized protein (TIGR03000 family)
MFIRLRWVAGVMVLLASSAVSQAQVYGPASAIPFPGSAQAATSQIYHYYNGVPYYQGFYYPGPAGNYPGPFDFRTEVGFDIPPLIIISPRVVDGTATGPAATVPPVLLSAPPQTASLDVRLPASATLYIQGQKTNQTGRERSFTTPPLEEGQPYRYNLKAVWSENGRVHEVERHVIVRAGGHALVLLDEAQGDTSHSSN